MLSKDIIEIDALLKDAPASKISTVLAPYRKDEAFKSFLLYAGVICISPKIKSVNMPNVIGEFDIGDQNGYILFDDTMNDIVKDRYINIDIDKLLLLVLSKYNYQSQLIIYHIIKGTIGDLLPNILHDYVISLYRLNTKINTKYERFYYDKYYYYIKNSRKLKVLLSTGSEINVNTIRITAVKDYKGEIKIYYNGRKKNGNTDKDLLTKVPNLNKELEIFLRDQYSVAVIGELYFNGVYRIKPVNAAILYRYKKTKTGAWKAKNITNPLFMPYDIMPLHTLIHYDSKIKYVDRYNWLKQIFEQMDFFRFNSGKGYSLKHIKLKKVYDDTKDNFNLMINKLKKDETPYIRFMPNKMYLKDKPCFLKMKKYKTLEFVLYQVLTDKKKIINKEEKTFTYRKYIKNLVVKHKNEFLFIEYGIDDEFSDEYIDKTQDLVGKKILIGTFEYMDTLFYRPFFIKIIDDKIEQNTEVKNES